MPAGDYERSGQAIAVKLGLEVRAQLRSADKLNEIPQLKEQRFRCHGKATPKNNYIKSVALGRWCSSTPGGMHPP